MRRAAFVVTLMMALGLAPAAEAQKKQKDQVLEAFLRDQFSQLNAQLGQLTERLNTIEAELGRMKQQQVELGNEVRNAQNMVKATDTSLSNLRLATQSDLFSLKTDLTQLRQDMTVLADLVKKGAPPAPALTPEPAASKETSEGYITEVAEKEKQVTINLGSASGVKVGLEFNVYRSNDPKNLIGIVEVIEVIDAKNSRAKIVYSKPDVKFEFSDIVRPRT